MVTPIRINQVDTKVNGIVEFGDSTTALGSIIKILKGSDGLGGELVVQNRFFFTDGQASGVRPFVYTGQQVFDGSIFSGGKVFNRSFNFIHSGIITENRLTIKVVNGYYEEEPPSVGDAVISFYLDKQDIVPNTLTVELDDDIIQYRGKDDGSGNIVDNGSTGGTISGTINYSTGLLGLVFSSIISAGATNIRVKYDYEIKILHIVNGLDQVVDIDNKGVFKLPVRTTVGINNPQTGMMVFDPSTNTVKVRTAIEWQDLLGGGGGIEVKPVRDIFDITEPTTGPFVLSQIPLGDTAIEKQAGILVFVNGVLVRPVEDYNYNVVGNNIIFVNPIEIGDEVQLCYLRRV